MSIVKPFTFVAGTKAKAGEVNDNFDVLYTQVNANISDLAQINIDIDNIGLNKANVNGSSTQRFSVADAVNNTDAVNKQYMMTYIDEKANTDLSNLSETGQDIIDSKADITNTFGYNQTLQNVTSQRTSGATYTNTTGKPIIVIVYDVRQDNVWHEFFIYVDDVQIGFSDGYGHNASGGMCTFIVPNGSTYRVNAQYIAGWVEYR